MTAIFQKVTGPMTRTIVAFLIAIFVVTSHLILSDFVFKDHRVYAAFNKEINYQGKLTDSAGVTVPDGLYHMTFRLYDVSTGGTAIWEEDRSTDAGDRITVSNGLFSVLLGSSTPLTTVDFNQTLYLGVEIGGSAGSADWDGEMEPRKKLGAVPASFETDRIDGLSSEQFLRSDAANSTSTSSNFLSFTQSGSGNIAEFIGQSSIPALTILSTGNVGIGTSSPSGRLTVWGESSTSGILANFANSASTSVLTILNNGNVGIGTTSPFAKLSVAGQVVADYFTATSTTATSSFANAEFTASLKTGEVLVVGDDGEQSIFRASSDSSSSRGVALSSAKGAAVSGDTIYVGPGVYDTSDLLKDGVNYHFNVGSSIVYTGSSAGAIFDDNGSAATSTISGYGVFVYQGGSGDDSDNHSVIDLSNAGSHVVIHAESLTSDVLENPNNSAIVLDAGTLYAYVSKDVVSTEYDGIVQNGGTLYLNADSLFALGETSANGSAIELTGGTANIRVRKMYSVTESSVDGVDGNLNLYADEIGPGGISNDGTGDFYVNAKQINANYGVSHGGAGGTLRVVGAKIVGDGDRPVNISGGATVVLENVTLEAGSYAHSVVGSGSVECLGCRMDKPTANGISLGYLTYGNNGNVGVGTSTPSARLTVWGTSASSGTLANFVNSASSSVMALLNNGNVGIGTTSPFAKLSVAGQVVADYFTATSTTATSTFAYDISTNGMISVSKSGNSAVIIGDTTGNARGTSALDIQSTRSASSTAVASGFESIAVGLDNTSSGSYASAFGSNNTVVGDGSSSYGRFNNVSGTANLGFGLLNTLSGTEHLSLGHRNSVVGTNQNIAIGYSNTVSTSGFSRNAMVFGQNNYATNLGNLIFGRFSTTTADHSSVFGSYINNSIASSTQIGPSDAAKITILGNTGSVGYVGIGTTSPYARLTVWGDSDSSGMISNFVNSASTSVLSVLNNGYVGIGNSSPQAPLHVGFAKTSSVQTGFEELAVIGADVAGIAGVAMGNQNTGTNSDFRFTVEDTEEAYIAFSMPSSGNTQTLFGNQRNTSAYIFTNNASAGTKRNLTIGTVDAKDLIFGTQNLERVRINSSGNIGFNTAGPDRRLDILDTSGPQLRLTYTDGSVYTDLQTDSAGALFLRPSTFDAVVQNATANGTILRIADGGGTGSTEFAGFYLTLDQANPKTSANSDFGIIADGNTDQVVQFVGDDVGNAIVITNLANRLNDHDHSVQTNPTLFIHSDTNPNSDNTQWLSLTHDQTNGFINTGSGSLILGSATGNVGIGTTSPFAKLSVAGRVVADYFTATSTTATSSFAYDISTTGMLSVLQSGTGATVVGDTSGNARGSGAIDVQSGRNTSARVASGSDSIAVGVNNQALGVGGIAIGTDNTSNSELLSVAVGYLNTTSGNYSSAFGVNNTTEVQYSTAIGYENTTSNYSFTSAVGVLNTASGYYGSSYGYTNNVGAGAVGGSSFGYANTSSANYGSAFGYSNTASGEGSSAFGYFNTASNTLANAFGSGNSVSGQSASAFGNSISNSINISTQIGPSDAAKITILGGTGVVGYTGIGTTSPSARLTVWGDSSSAGRLANFVNNASSSVMTLLNSGRVGIGVANPLFALNVVQLGQTPDSSAVLSTDDQLNSTVSVQGSGQAYFMGRDISNDIEFVMGTSNLGAAFAGSMTNHDFQIRTGNSTRMTIKTSTGRVGIGEASPGSLLSVNGNATVGASYSTVAAPTNGLLVQGNVGIGDSSPLSLLDVGGISSALDSLLDPNGIGIAGTGATLLGIENTALSSSSNGAFFGLYSNDNGAMVSGDRLGGVAFGGSSTSGTLRNSTAIEAFAEQNWVNNSAYGSYIRFATTPLSSTTRTEAMRISANGLVGIGTTTPVSTLSVQGSLCVRNTGTCGTTAGTIYATTATVQGIDLAENYQVADETIEPGEIVTVDQDNPTFVKRASQGDTVIGIVSTAPGFLLGRDIDQSKPIALTGRVPLKVNDEAGEIVIGDRIAVSSVDGVGMKALSPNEETVAIALESFDGTNGVIEVFVDRKQGVPSQLTVMGNGNVGIGKTDSKFKLDVAGDIGGFGFVVPSKSELMSGIKNLSEEDYDLVLEKISSMELSSFKYNGDPRKEKRFGFTDSYAPSEILTANGDIDIYKLSSFTLAGVKAQQFRIESLEDRIKEIEDKIANEGYFGAEIFEEFFERLSDMGVRISNGLAEFRSLITEDLTVGSSNKPSGITVYDEKTGEPYCLKVVDGELKNVAGTCENPQEVDEESKNRPDINESGRGGPETKDELDSKLNNVEKDEPVDLVDDTVPEKEIDTELSEVLRPEKSDKDKVDVGGGSNEVEEDDDASSDSESDEGGDSSDSAGAAGENSSGESDE